MSEQALDLRRSAQIVRRHKRLMGLLVVLGILVGGAAYIVFAPPMLTSTALVALPQDSNAQAGALVAAEGGADPYTATERIVATSNTVLLDALPNVSPAMSLDQLRRDIQVASPTPYVISVSAKGKVAADAETTANAVARSYVSYVGSGTSSTRVLAQLFEPGHGRDGRATKAAYPLSPRRRGIRGTDWSHHRPRDRPQRPAPARPRPDRRFDRRSRPGIGFRRSPVRCSRLAGTPW